MRKSALVFAVLTLSLLFLCSTVQAEKHAAMKEKPKGLVALVLKVHMKAEYREQFIKEMWADAISSEKKEPGCMMFNIVNDNADPNILYLFEVYKDDNALQTHKKTPHFLKWLETTKDWLAAPLEVMPCTTIYPPANAWKKRPAPKE